MSFDWASLLPGVGTAALAIISGAGGSALLEIFWKPRRDRRKAATLLAAEIGLNTELAILQAHARWRARRKIPGDLSFSRLAWDATTDLLRELPPDLLKRILLLYTRYEHLNYCVEDYGKTVDELQTAKNDPHRENILKHHLNSTIDVFNTALDTTIDSGKEIMPLLLKAAGIKETKDKNAPRDYAKDVDKLLREREERIRALGAMDRAPETSAGDPDGSKDP